MHSVEPQHTVTSVSGSYSRPVKRRVLAPQVMAYWFTSACTAREASSLSGCGAGKSGKPWARLTPPCCWQSRVISRITDSVKRVLRSETGSRMRAVIVPCAAPAPNGDVGRRGR